MSAWIVYSKDGKTQRCELKRLEYSGSHMGERAVTATFEHHSEVAFDVFDYIVYRGEKFELESIPSVKKVSRNEYEYELRFVSLKYELERCEMRDIVPNDNGVVYPTPLTFSFTGDVRYLAERIQANLDALYGKGVWNIVVAEGVSSDEKNISIAQQNCWNALSLVNTTYGLNFSVRGREVVIGGEIDAVSHTFQYGKGNGLYEIERASDTEIGIVTKLRAYGSTKNLDYSYPKKPEWADSALPVSFALSPLRLMLPSFKEDGKTDYVLADDAVISKYGIREASIVYEDIYPSIAGAKNSSGQAIDEIASVDAVNEESSTFTVYLHNLGFDLEEHLTTAEAQLSMKTGTLQGYTFNISVIDRLSNGGYKLTLGRNSVEGSEESGFNVPNKDWNMKAGDKFVLLNILMPQVYIREAEQRLLVRAKEYLAEYGKTNFSYNVGLHDKFLVEHPSVYDSLVEGMKLRVQDNELGISEDVIIQSITITEASDDNILPQVKVTLNNKPSASTLDRIQGKLNDVIAETSANNFSSQNELMAQYRKKLDKPFFDKLFSAVDANGNEIASNDVSTPVAYIKAKYDVLVLGGVTMYGNDESLDLPTLAEGLPFDQKTIWFNPETKQIEVIGGTGGGGEGGVSNFWDLSGIPSWITNTKPKYNYSEIEGTPDLSVFVTGTVLSDTLADYATLSFLTSELKKYVTLDGAQDIKGVKNFVNGLKIGGMPITKKQDDVVYLDANLVVRGGITMYGDGEGGSSIPSYSTLGSLENVDKDAIDAVASVDRVLFQSAGSNVWSWKALSEIGGGSVSGDYLPLSGGTLTGPLTISGTSASTSFLNFSRDGYSYITGKTLSFGPSSDTIDRMLLITSGSATFQCDILPSANNTYNIGAWDTYFKRLYANTLYAGANSNSVFLVSGASGDTNGVVVARSSNGSTATELMRFNTNGIVFDSAQQGYIRVDEGKNIYLYKGVDAKSVMLGEGYFKPLKAANGLLKLGNYDSTWNGLYLKANAINTSIMFCDTSGNGTISFAGSNNGNAGIYATGSVFLRPACTAGASGTITNSGIGVEINTEGKVLPSNSVVLPNNVSYQGLSSDGTATNLAYINSNNNLIIGYGVASINKYTFIDGENIVFRQGDSHAEKMRLTSTDATFQCNILPSATNTYYIGDWGKCFTMANINVVYSGATTNNMWLVGGNNSDNIGVVIGRNSTNTISGSEICRFNANGLVWADGVTANIRSTSGAIQFWYKGLETNGVYLGNATFSPFTASTDLISLGSYSKRWKGVYLGTSTSSYNNVNGVTFCDSSGNGVSRISQATNMGIISSGAIYLRPASTKGASGTITASSIGATIDTSGNMLVTGGITMYSDQRKKTILNHVELSLKQIADAPLIEHYYNSDQDKTTHVGSIAQYWAQINDWFCKLDAEGYYTMEIQNCALASAISIARHLEKYETKTDKTIRKMKKRIQELEDKLERLEGGKYGCN